VPSIMRMKGSKGSKVSAFEPMFKGYMLVRHFIRCRRLIPHVVEAERVADQQMIRMYPIHLIDFSRLDPYVHHRDGSKWSFHPQHCRCRTPSKRGAFLACLRQGRYNVCHGGMLTHHQ
jgi:hypothetical protein